jgi:hypothetical protein
MITDNRMENVKQKVKSMSGKKPPVMEAKKRDSLASPVMRVPPARPSIPSPTSGQGSPIPTFQDPMILPQPAQQPAPTIQPAPTPGSTSSGGEAFDAMRNQRLQVAPPLPNGDVSGYPTQVPSNNGQEIATAPALSQLRQRLAQARQLPGGSR